jgi:hypothetical protein
VDELVEAFAGALVSLEPEPFVEPDVEVDSDDFFSDVPPPAGSLPFDSLPEEEDEPFDDPSFGRESVR